MQDWETLRQNNAEQKKALLESQKEWKEAKKAQTESNQALLEARALLESSQLTSSEMQEKLISLLNESATLKAEIAMLRKELSEAKGESATASDALNRANQFLADTKKRLRRMKRLGGSGSPARKATALMAARVFGCRRDGDCEMMIADFETQITVNGNAKKAEVKDKIKHEI